LLTRSLLLTLKNVLFASVATAFAKKLFPVPGGPYRRIPFQGVRLPVKRWGNLIGRMTASLRDSLAAERPATSDHWTLGVSDRMAPGWMEIREEGMERRIAVWGGKDERGEMMKEDENEWWGEGRRGEGDESQRLSYGWKQHQTLLCEDLSPSSSAEYPAFRPALSWQRDF
jgi:hypothetical protein